MADDKTDKTTPAETPAEPTSNERKTIQEDYAKASPKDKLKKFIVDPTTKTLRRA